MQNRMHDLDELETQLGRLSHSLNLAKMAVEKIRASAGRLDGLSPREREAQLFFESLIGHGGMVPL